MEIENPLIQDFIVELVATICGVAIGIPVAFWIDRRSRLRSQREKAITILKSLKEEINHNLGLLRQMGKELKPNSVIFYNLDMNTWRTISLGEFIGVISEGIINRIFRLYYEYEHFSRKIDVQFNMHYSAMRAMGNIYMIERERIVNAILVLIPPWEKESEQLIEDIDNEIERLSN